MAKWNALTYVTLNEGVCSFVYVFLISVVYVCSVFTLFNNTF